MRFTRFSTALASALVSATFLASPGLLTPASASDQYPPTANCPAQADWFPHSKTPEPPFETFQSTTNCVFHQWSWQAFLWLTQEDAGTGEPRFLSFMAPSELFENSKHTGGMLPRMGKSKTPETVNEFLQAGTDGILVDLSGRAVYYSQYLDSTFADFVTQNGLNDPVKLAAFDPNTPFPDGTLELKASWKIVQPGEDVSSFFTMQSEINLLANQGGKIVISDKTAPATLALVGFHIGGRVNGHPEMIWATFEHVSNAPNVPAGATASTIVSDQNWTFYKANTPYSGCNVNTVSSTSLKLDEATQILSPVTQVCRVFEFGNDPNDPVNDQAKIKTNDSNIAELNVQVEAALKKENDVWANYLEVGAIWFKEIDALVPNDPLATDTLMTGSFKLSNSTIETFTQTQSVMNNCFRCHNTEQRFPPSTTMMPLPGLNVDISHIIVNGYFWEQE